MFPLKLAALAAACGFGAYFGWHTARYLVEGIAAFIGGFVDGFRKARN